MGYTDNMSPEMKQRIVQELVPGKQISLAHIIANPDKILYTKLGLGLFKGSHWNYDCQPCRDSHYYGRHCHEVIRH